jgi:hypothetical protein
VASDHIDELGFAPDARSAIKAARSFNKARGSYDWLHVNSATYVGPNQWFDKGDMRFAPNNVIISSREASLLAIRRPQTARSSGRLVRTSVHRRSCGRFARSSDSITRI